MDRWDDLHHRLAAVNGRIDDALRRKDQSAFHLACRERYRITAALVALYLTGPDRETQEAP